MSTTEIVELDQLGSRPMVRRASRDFGNLLGLTESIILDIDETYSQLLPITSLSVEMRLVMSYAIHFCRSYAQPLLGDMVEFLRKNLPDGFTHRIGL